MSKIIDKAAFMALLKDNQRIMVGGFMTVGTPEQLIDWVVESNVKDLTIICNDAGYPEQGVGKLIKNNQVKTLIASHIGLNPVAGAKMSDGTLEVILVPQGTLAEQIRAFGAGLGGILTPTGVNTVVEENKQVITIDDKKYLLEVPIGADLSLVLAHQSDVLGNLTYDKTARNFNPVMATAALKVVAQVTYMKDFIDPEIIVTPHVLVDGIITKEVL